MDSVSWILWVEQICPDTASHHDVLPLNGQRNSGANHWPRPVKLWVKRNPSSLKLLSLRCLRQRFRSRLMLTGSIKELRNVFNYQPHHYYFIIPKLSQSQAGDAAQIEEYLACTGPCVPFQHHIKSGMVLYTCDTSTWEIEARRLAIYI